MSGGLWEHCGEGANCACGGAWSGANQKGFAKMLISELGFDGCIGVYQVVNGRSGIPGTRKGSLSQRKIREQGTIISVVWQEAKCMKRKNGME